MDSYQIVYELTFNKIATFTSLLDYFREGLLSNVNFIQEENGITVEVIRAVGEVTFKYRLEYDLNERLNFVYDITEQKKLVFDREYELLIEKGLYYVSDNKKRIKNSTIA